MKWIVTLALLTSLHSSIVISKKTDETIVLVCNAEVWKAISEADGQVQAQVIREETGTMIIRGSDRTISFLDEHVTDWGIYRSSEGLIDGGPEQDWIRTNDDGTDEIKTLHPSWLEVDPYTGKFEFFPNAEMDEGGATYSKMPIGSSFYIGTCKKSGKPNF